MPLSLMHKLTPFNIGANQHIRLLRIAEINQKIIHRKRPLLHNRPDLRKTRILVPATALMKPSERQKRSDKKDQL